MLVRWYLRLASLALLCLAPSLAQRTQPPRPAGAHSAVRASTERPREVAEQARLAGLQLAFRGSQTGAGNDSPGHSHPIASAVAQRIRVAHRGTPTPPRLPGGSAPGAQNTYDATAPPLQS